MSTPTARLLLLPLIVAIAVIAVVSFGGPGDQAAGIGNAPPECFSDEDRPEDGTPAPSDLTLSWSPYWQNGMLVSAISYLSWEDNSGDELCFIVEFRSIGGGYQSTHVADANETTISMSSFGCETYRVYALTATGRSAYSNEVSISENCNPGQHTFAPTPVPTGPYIPPDCFVSDEPSADGPAAPSDLIVTWSPYYVDGILLDAVETIEWSDNSADETCFVVEIKHAAGDWQTLAAKSGCNACGQGSHSYVTGYGMRTYRVYAATATARSEYSGVATIDKPAPTPTLAPGVAKMRGDLNCDTGIDAVDSLVLLRHDAGLSTSLPQGCPGLSSIVITYPAGTQPRPRSDLNCDGGTSPLDALAPLRFDLALNPGLPTGCDPLDALVVPAPLVEG